MFVHLVVVQVFVHQLHQVVVHLVQVFVRQQVVVHLVRVFVHQQEPRHQQVQVLQVQQVQDLVQMNLRLEHKLKIQLAIMKLSLFYSLPLPLCLFKWF